MNLNMRNFRSPEVRHDSAAQTIYPGRVMVCARFKGGACALGFAKEELLR
jgi:hypothetical protein